MDFTVTKNGDISVMKMEGKFGAETSGDFEKKIMEVIDSGCRKLSVDLTELLYINSSGLRVFLMAAKNMKKVEGRMVLFGAKTHIKEIFDMTGFTTVIKMVNTEEEAAAAL